MSKATVTRPSRRILLVLAALRGVLGVVAVPLVPVLYRDHFVVLVLLRPTKEILLAAGFFIREGEARLLAVLAAALPLALFGVWLFYALGRSYSDELQSGDELPRWAQGILRPDRVENLSRILEKKGRALVVLGRLAAFPSTLLGAAAGASGMGPGSFLAADGLGCVLSVAAVVGAGYVLGAAYKEAGPWMTGVGVVVLFGLLIALGRWLRREGKERSAEKREG
jgi:membrane protein DedA with SNARE-associated domain